MTLPVFTNQELQIAKSALNVRIEDLTGSKLQEADWAHVYCKARGIEFLDWRNQNAYVTTPGLSLEHKMMRCSESEPIKQHCGTDMMHPALTRRVSLPDIADANEAMRIVIASYQKVLDERLEQAAKISEGRPVELRSGWLLYDSSLTEFLYFEERAQNLDPKKHKAIWSERTSRGNGGRRGNKNLWIYTKGNGEPARKVWSVTGGGSGTKIQPYFRVPAADDQNLYYFRVQGEPINSATVRVWVTEPTAHNLKNLIGRLDVSSMSQAILKVSAPETGLAIVEGHEQVQELVISNEAYSALKEKFVGKSDEHSFQLLCKRLSEDKSFKKVL